MQDSLDQLLTLYRDSFPRSERRSEPDLLHALASPAYRIVTRKDRRHLLGFAILFIPPTEDFALLEYLAVHPNHRGRGIGRTLISSAIEEAHGRTLLTEIESPSTDPATTRRQQLYAGCGFRHIDGLIYHLPLPGNPPPMELWIHSNPPAPIDRNGLQRWLTTIYTNVYDCPPNDLRIGQMLAGLPPTIQVERVEP